MKLNEIKQPKKKDLKTPDYPSVLKKQAGYNKGDEQKYPPTGQFTKRQAD